MISADRADRANHQADGARNDAEQQGVVVCAGPILRLLGLRPRGLALELDVALLRDRSLLNRD